MFWDLPHPPGSQAVVTDEGRQLTYGQLAQSVGAFRQVLPTSARKQLGFIFCRNDAGSLFAYLAGLQRGDALCLLDAKMDPALRDRLLSIYHPDWIVAPNQFMAGEFGGSGTPIGESALYVPERTNEGADLLIHPDLALLLPTSGTTGNAKLVRLSGANLEANADAIASYLQLASSERPVTTLPMNYSYGLSVINSHLKSGATLLLTNHSIASRPFWEFFKLQGATSMAGVPYTYQILERMRLDKMELPGLKTLTQAGGRLDPKLVKHFAGIAGNRGWRFFVMYGATEATARMSYLPPEAACAKPGSIGIPIPGGAFRIESTGELVYRGPNVMMGYAETREQLARGDDLQGILHTGDLAERDDDGYYSIVGRMSRFLKLFGMRINLDDIEKMIEARAQSCVACTGTDDKLWVFVEQESAVAIAKHELNNTYRLHHTAYAVRVIPEILRNANGKIAYNQLQQWMS